MLMLKAKNPQKVIFPFNLSLNIDYDYDFLNVNLLHKKYYYKNYLL